MNCIYYFDSPWGTMGVAGNDKAITRLFVRQRPEPGLFEEKEIPLLANAKAQLDEYFAGERVSFDLPFQPQGPEFHKKVWQALVDIPYGETRTYKEIALQVGSPNGFRAVGQANSKNPLPIFYPCHRVIGCNNKLVGYAFGTAMKLDLLRLEKCPLAALV